MGLPTATLDRLVFAKYLFHRGAEEIERGREVGMSMAVLHFHDCLELFLQCIAESVGVDDRNVPFPAYGAKIKEKAKKAIALARVVDKVNGLRVPLKHQGLPPGRSALKGLSAEVEVFLEQNSQLFLDISFNSVSLADVIADPTAGEHVKAAEAAIESGKYADAFQQLDAGFDALLASESARLPQREQFGRRLDRDIADPNDVPKLEVRPEDERMRRMVKRMNERFSRVVAAIEPLRLGLDPSEYQRFRQLTHRVQTALHETRENAAFCLSFVVDAALRMQDTSLTVRDPASRYTVEVEAESVSVLMFAPEGVVEERLAPRGERFENVKVTIVGNDGKAGPTGEHWMLGEFDESRRWEGVRFLPLKGMRIVEEHRPVAIRVRVGRAAGGGGPP